MRFIVDEGARKLIVTEPQRELDLHTPEAFTILSKTWLRVGWDLKYVYSFTWLGRPVIQLPEDLIRIQELVYRVRPDVLIETGVAHGGSLVFYASLFRAIGRGRVVGVEIDLRPENRKAIEAHELADLIQIVDGDSAAAKSRDAICREIRPGETVLIVLDSKHTKDHVRAELESLGPLVTSGSYIVVADGSMEFLYDLPRGNVSWKDDNPKKAALEFLQDHPEFLLEEPGFPFNEGRIAERVTHWPSAFLRRLA